MKKKILILILLLAFLTAGYFLVTKIVLVKVKEKIENEKIVAQYMTLGQKEEIFPIDRNANRPTTLLVLEPGYYQFFDKTYDLTNEGFYSFKKGTQIINRIIYKEDRINFVASFSWIDNEDAESTKVKDLSEYSQNHFLKVSCGNIASLAAGEIDKKDIKVRQVMGFNLDNSFKDDVDNGHTMIEVDINNRWRLVDLDHDSFIKQGDKYLTFYEFYQVIRDKEDYHFEKITTDENITDKDLKDYFQNIFDVPMIYYKTGFYYTTDSEAEKENVGKYSHRYRFMDRASWMEKFYKYYNYQ